MRVARLPASVKPIPPPVQSDDDAADEAQGDSPRGHHVSAWAVLLAALLSRIDDLTDDLASGMIDEDEWARSFRDELTAAHGEAYSIGRKLGGDGKATNARDHAAGVSAWANQEEFFRGLLYDLANDRYTLADGNLNVKGFGNRARSYGRAPRGTLHRGFADALGGELGVWELGDKDHCKPSPDFPTTCEREASKPPRPASEFEFLPGEGDTPCINECDCTLASADGRFRTSGIS